MDDFLATEIRYYSKFNLKRQVKPVKPVGTAAEEAFAKVLIGLKAFLHDALKVEDQYRRDCLDTLDTFQQERNVDLKKQANETFAAVSDLAKELMPKVQQQEVLPAELLKKLNATMTGFESRYQGAIAKSDVLPEQLLTAAPGSKLYPGLLKKVEAICQRKSLDFELREVEAFRAWLQKGAKDVKFDACVKQHLEKRSSKVFDLSRVHKECLVQSDHFPIFEDVQLPGSSEPLLPVLAWNTLEFPSFKTTETGLVLDGISPYCSEITRVLDSKNPEERTLLLEVMSSEPVILGHMEEIWAKVHAAVNQGRVVLLQEVNHDVAQKVKDECSKYSWTALFSQANQDSTKCNAITGIVSKESFEETTQVEIVENKKTRFFMAARRQEIWFVSCHVPLVTGKKLAPGINEDVATKVLEQLVGELLGGKGKVLIAGGDWNANVREVAARKPANRQISLYAPTGKTSFGNEHTIDAIFCLW